MVVEGRGLCSERGPQEGREKYPTK